jgi:hypothetical protein
MFPPPASTRLDDVSGGGKMKKSEATRPYQGRRPDHFHDPAMSSAATAQFIRISARRSEATVGPAIQKIGTISQASTASMYDWPYMKSGKARPSLRCFAIRPVTA